MRARFFTIVEMLIVVAIIAILAALLSPALQKALQQAQGVGCAGNMRNIHMAFTAYAADNHGYYPPLSIHRRDNSWVSWWHQEVAGQYLNHVVDWRNSDGRGLGPIRCPAVRDRGIGYSNHDYPYPNFNTNVLQYYSMEPGKYLAHKDKSGNKWTRMSRARNAPRLLILADAVNQDGVPSDSFGNLFERVPARHAGRANGGFADGHIRASECFYAEYRDRLIDVQLLAR